ncbi:tRNA (adenosine(37)-N6)-threonylcarbamoyltransferase complex dimerization subunit type 1 TsaB [Deinococcus arenicola]|uniref:tRNA (Adenosine(37)-N6)-threonylcarbamoyltransferase complex dimerization subunit type 1 TsaB n=1 Tax=Deinococcus arenicola TaxID=2994950 RepID=A0ABU4DRG7_9DEIO|nr:tRNA (adenosine(37)-N6)-threonylcarbamoyltransferase complex dimerization subunit type 1 TsaB [Deinococcus sp. ZS9-10]MDV6375030.1 tRNA (adenosine(37)-N6)-threonylcarbamoyltransferase complex dimerization subunit type 1 TsaB [Deinococcus sp. ZS9-10]
MTASTLLTPVILALDTATPHLTLALRWDGGEVAFSKEVGRAHAEELPAATRELFAGAGLSFHADLIVIGTGPGSYTGVRVGASYALGLGRVWGAAVRGISTLEALVRGDGPQAVSLDARKGNVYGAVYEVRAGAVDSVQHAPHKLSLEDFQALAGSLPQLPNPTPPDLAPNGLALLEAGVRHGTENWELAYL